MGGVGVLGLKPGFGGLEAEQEVPGGGGTAADATAAASRRGIWPASVPDAQLHLLPLGTDVVHFHRDLVLSSLGQHASAQSRGVGELCNSGASRGLVRLPCLLGTSC